MQPLAWYIHRFHAMSVGEIVWRLHTALRNELERFLPRVFRPEGNARLALEAWAEAWQPPYRVSDLALGEWTSAAAEDNERRWAARLAVRADRVAAKRLTYFDLTDHHLGDPIDWNRDHKNDISAPLKFSASINYRDFDTVGDCKFVWEPNRHHQFVVLARAYRATGDSRYVEALGEQWRSWIDQCPPGKGMNWRSPLEIAVRLINWVWAYDLVRESEILDRRFHTDVMSAAYLHLEEITRNYSRFSSAGNHLIGEAAGVFVATSYLTGFPESEKWHAQAREILEREIVRQTYCDGGNKEQALGYHLFTLQFFLLAFVAAEHGGDALSAGYRARMEKIFEFIAALLEGGETLPEFGDCDDGYVFDLGEGPPNAGELLGIGAILYQRADFKKLAGAYCEPSRWLLGRAGRARYEELADENASPRMQSRSFPESGYYILQNGACDDSDRISVVFDCGPLGLEPMAGHGHADAMSFTLRAFGEDVLVDPGTYDYYTDDRWRAYFRSTRAHNTVVIDDLDQSNMLGRFLWGRVTKARCCGWEARPEGGLVIGEHEGYTRLSDPVLHRRLLELDGPRRELVVRDTIRCQGQHEVGFYLHFAEHCRVERIGLQRFIAHVRTGVVTIDLDSRLRVQQAHGNEEPIAGWVSRGYHRKAPATTLIGQCTAGGDLELQCRLTIGVPRKERLIGCEEARTCAP